MVGTVQYGRITGYTNDTFRPEAATTRTRVTTATNHLLDWTADKDYVNDHADELHQLPDMSTPYWGYHDIMEATSTHNYRVYDGEEH